MEGRCGRLGAALTTDPSPGHRQNSRVTSLGPRRQRAAARRAAPATRVATPTIHSPDKNAPVEARVEVVAGDVTGLADVADVAGVAGEVEGAGAELDGVETVGLVTTAGVATT